MDLRDNIHEQLAQHIATLRVIAKQETPPLLVWEEMQRILGESAMSLELFVLPKVEAKTPYLDLRSGNLGALNRTAEYVGATSEDDGFHLPERKTLTGGLLTGGFLRGSANGLSEGEAQS